MTIDEAIKHCLEVAEENELAAGTYEILAENNQNAYEKLTAETNSSRCAECAADHRQLAAWLRELVGAKRLLKAAVDGFKFLGAWMDDQGDCTLECTDCPLHRTGINCRCWNKQGAALALIGEEKSE